MKLTGYEQSAVKPGAARELRLAVEEFHAEYCAVLDNGQVEKWPAFFTEDAVYRVTAKENADSGLLVGLVYAESRAMLEDRAMAISRAQMFAPRYFLHLVSNVRIMRRESNGEFIAHSNFMLLQTLVEGPTTLHMAGRYYDRFVQADDGLLLKERQVVYDTTMIANDLAYPV